MKETSKTKWISGVALLAMAFFPAVAQDNATEAAKKAAETAFQNPQLQEMLKKVKDDPDAALKNVSQMAKEQMNRVQGNTPAKEVPATRAEVSPGLPTVSHPSRPVAIPLPAPAPSNIQAPPATPDPRMQIPEPVARGERPVPVSPTTVREPSLATPPPVAAPIAAALIATPPSGIPAPRPLTPRFKKDSTPPSLPSATNKAPKKPAGADQMQITADASVMDEKNSILTFTGNVVVQHPGFDLTGDKLVIYMNEEQGLAGEAAPKDEDAPPFKKAIATGGMVEIVRRGADGKSQVAKSRKADYNAATGDIILSGGPPTLQNGGVFINPSSPQALIVLKGNGQHEVKGEGGRVGFSMPLKGGTKATGGLPGGDLNSISNRRDP